MNFLIRKSETKDMSSVFELIQELAEAKGVNNVSITIYDLIRDGFSDKSKFKMHVAEYEDEIIGFSLFYKAYSVEGKSLILEDVFVSSKYKKSGIGLTLFSKFLEYANQNNINLLEWSFREKYKSLGQLYLNAGATILDDIAIYRIFKEDIKELIKSKFVLESDFYKIRLIVMQDMPRLLELIEELHSFNKQENKLTVYDLIKDCFGTNSWFKAFVVEVKEEVVGFMIFHNAYSTFYGQSLIIDVVYITEKYNDIGLGKMLYYGFFDYASKKQYNRVSQKVTDKRKNAVSNVEFFGGKKVKGLKVVNISNNELSKFINKKE